MIETVEELQVQLAEHELTRGWERPMSRDWDDDDQRYAYEIYYRTKLKLRALGVKVA